MDHAPPRHPRAHAWPAPAPPPIIAVATPVATRWYGCGVYGCLLRMVVMMVVVVVTITAQVPLTRRARQQAQSLRQEGRV